MPTLVELVSEFCKDYKKYLGDVTKKLDDVQDVIRESPGRERSDEYARVFGDHSPGQITKCICSLYNFSSFFSNFKFADLLKFSLESFIDPVMLFNSMSGIIDGRGDTEMINIFLDALPLELVNFDVHADKTFVLKNIIAYVISKGIGIDMNSISTTFWRKINENDLTKLYNLGCVNDTNLIETFQMNNHANNIYLQILAAKTRVSLKTYSRIAVKKLIDSCSSDEIDKIVSRVYQKLNAEDEDLCFVIKLGDRLREDTVLEIFEDVPMQTKERCFYSCVDHSIAIIYNIFPRNFLENYVAKKCTGHYKLISVYSCIKVDIDWSVSPVFDTDIEINLADNLRTHKSILMSKYTNPKIYDKITFNIISQSREKTYAALKESKQLINELVLRCADASDDAKKELRNILGPFKDIIYRENWKFFERPRVTKITDAKKYNDIVVVCSEQ